MDRLVSLHAGTKSLLTLGTTTTENRAKRDPVLTSARIWSFHLQHNYGQICDPIFILKRIQNCNAYKNELLRFQRFTLWKVGLLFQYGSPLFKNRN